MKVNWKVVKIATILSAILGFIMSIAFFPSIIGIGHTILNAVKGGVGGAIGGFAITTLAFLFTKR